MLRLNIQPYQFLVEKESASLYALVCKLECSVIRYYSGRLVNLAYALVYAIRNLIFKLVPMTAPWGIPSLLLTHSNISSTNYVIARVLHGAYKEIQADLISYLSY
jgi:hypothetical protein